jgi:hypothetical protein
MSLNVHTQNNRMSDVDVADLSATLLFSGLKEISAEYTVFRVLSHSS